MLLLWLIKAVNKTISKLTKLYKPTGKEIVYAVAIFKPPLTKKVS